MQKRCKPLTAQIIFTTADSVRLSDFSVGVVREGGNSDGKRRKKKKKRKELEECFFLGFLPTSVTGTPTGVLWVGWEQGRGELGQLWIGASISSLSQPHNCSYQRKSQAGRGMGLLSSAAAFLARHRPGVPEGQRGFQDRQGVSGPCTQKTQTLSQPQTCRF